MTHGFFGVQELCNPHLTVVCDVERIQCFPLQEDEFNWLLKEEVHAVLKQLQDILKVFPPPLFVFFKEYFHVACML